MKKLEIVALAAAILIFISGVNVKAQDDDDPFLLLAVDPEDSILDIGAKTAVTLINYAALKAAMEKKPDIIRARIKACGRCKDKALLEKELAIAEQDKLSIRRMESFALAFSAGSGTGYRVRDPWLQWKIMQQHQLDATIKEAPACVPLLNRYFNCMLDHKDLKAGEKQGACYPDKHLTYLCRKGEARPFYEYVAFLRKRLRGEMVFETENNRDFYYYNVKPATAFPLSPVDDNKPRYSVYTDNKVPGALRSASVSGMAITGPYIDFSRGEDFRKPWNTIVHYDNGTVSQTARLLECSYLLPNPNLVRSFKFWYRIRPAGAEKDYLLSRMKNHPLLRVGDPIEQCPTSETAARALLPLVPTETLRMQYGELLQQPGDNPDDEPSTETPEQLRQRREAIERERLRRRPESMRQDPGTNSKPTTPAEKAETPSTSTRTNPPASQQETNDYACRSLSKQIESTRAAVKATPTPGLIKRLEGLQEIYRRRGCRP